MRSHPLLRCSHTPQSHVAAVCVGIRLRLVSTATSVGRPRWGRIVLPAQNPSSPEVFFLVQSHVRCDVQGPQFRSLSRLWTESSHKVTFIIPSRRLGTST